MITQEDIDAMSMVTDEEWEELIKKADEIVAERKSAVLTSIERQLVKHIEYLEMELAEYRVREKQVLSEHKAEKELSDRLAASYAMSLNDKAKVKACPSLAAYRKARGL